MSPKYGNLNDRQVVIDLTVSDDELEDTDSRQVPNITLPDPSNPINPRRLTAAECLRADRIAHGEVDPVLDWCTQDPSPQSLVEATDIDYDSAVPVIEDTSDETEWFASIDKPLIYTRSDHLRAKGPELQDAAFYQRGGNEIPLQRGVPNLISYTRERSHVSHSICASSEGGDFSDHESVLYKEEDSNDLTMSDERVEVVEKMASGRPRRACAPKSFKGLMQESTSENREFLVEKMANGQPRRACAPKSFKGLMPKSTSENRESLDAEKWRADLIERANVAYRELWKNRLEHGFSHSCGRIDDGNARTAMIQIAQSLGAKSKVVKRSESGKKVKHVVMKPTRRLRSPSELNIQQTVDRIMTRLCTLGDVHNMSRPVNDGADNRVITRGIEKKDNKKQKGNARLEVVRESKQLTEFEQEVKRDERALESAELVDDEDKRRADLIDRATTACRELWENRLIDGFSHSCGRIDDGNARTAMIQIAQSFGAESKVVKRSESGKKVKHVVMKPSRRLRSPSELNIQETAVRIMNRLHVFSDSESRDSTRDSIMSSVQHACTTRETRHRDLATKRELSPQENIKPAGAEDTPRAIFQRKRQRQLEGAKIGTANKGFSMLTKMGWAEGGRLGARENGISEPIVAQFRVGRSGLGAK